MFKKALPRPWVCSRCLQRQIQVQRRPKSTAAATLTYKPRGGIPIDNTAPGALHDDKTLRKIFDSPNFWADFSQSSKVGLTGRSIGLFQNRYLTQPKGFEDFANNTVRKAKRIVEEVLRMATVEEYKTIVRDLDRLSDLLCRVIDLSDFVRSTHPDPKIQRAASNSYAMIYEYMNVLNTTTGLNTQLNNAMANPEVVESWSEEELVVADILKADFMKSAIDLPQAQRQRFVSLSQEIAEVGTEFVEYMEPAKPSVTFPSSKLLGMDPTVVRDFTRWGQVTFPSIGGPASAALRSVQDENVRKELFMASRTSSRKQIERLETLLMKRIELAKLSGYESFGRMSLGDKMAKSPESVNEFLQALSKDNGFRVEREMASLIQEKSHSGKRTTDAFQAWDRDYFMTQIVSSARSRARTADFLSAYLSLGTVMQGLSRLFTRLYGIRFVPHETMPGETWHSDVRRLDVVSDTDGHVAVLYCDLFSRPGKSPNPAHFTLRCSREITRSEVEEASSSLDLKLFGTPEEAANDGMAISKSGGVLKQLPTIALICDFSTTSPGSPIPSLLTLGEVITLFHEMGHAIHSILGRTSLQNVSGTRCVTDFAELPSVLMEYFAADPAVLSLYARHYEMDFEIDHPLPYDLIADQVAVHKRFEACDTEAQIIMSMADQAYHSTLPSSPSFDSTKIYREIQTTYGKLPADPLGTSWQGFFGHLYGYGSTYYSYLFDRVLAERIWQVVFSSGTNSGAVDRANGERMKEHVLKWGGGRDPWRCLADVLKDGRVESGGEKAMAVVGSWGVKNNGVSL